MKVILIQDVKSLGKKGDTVEVSDGYARNFILPKKLGMEATAANLNTLKLQKANEERIAKEQYDKALALKEQIEKSEVVCSVKTGENGKSFGSVSTKEIGQAITDQLKLDIDKKKIVLNNPIKNPGVFHVDIKLHAKVSANLTVKVTEE